MHKHTIIRQIKTQSNGLKSTPFPPIQDPKTTKPLTNSSLFLTLSISLSLSLQTQNVANLSPHTLSHLSPNLSHSLPHSRTTAHRNRNLSPSLQLQSLRKRYLHLRSPILSPLFLKLQRLFHSLRSARLDSLLSRHDLSRYYLHSDSVLSCCEWTPHD